MSRLKIGPEFAVMAPESTISFWLGFHRVAILFLLLKVLKIIKFAKEIQQCMWNKVQKVDLFGGKRFRVHWSTFKTFYFFFKMLHISTSFRTLHFSKFFVWVVSSIQHWDFLFVVEVELIISESQCNKKLILFFLATSCCGASSLPWALPSFLGWKPVQAFTKVISLS